jgi:hypothetical protein
VEGKGRESHIVKKNGRYVPLLVTVNEPWRNRADVRACTDEQEDDEQEGLEVEQRRLRWSTGTWESRQSSLKRKYVERYRPWCCCKRKRCTRFTRDEGVLDIYLFIYEPIMGSYQVNVSKRQTALHFHPTLTTSLLSFRVWPPHRATVPSSSLTSINSGSF